VKAYSVCQTVDLHQERFAVHEQFKLFRAGAGTLASRLVEYVGSTAGFNLGTVPKGLYKANIHLVYNITAHNARQRFKIGKEHEYAQGETEVQFLAHNALHPFSRGTEGEGDRDRSRTFSESVLIVAPEEELIPSYDWQDLRGYHTIPKGIETRLPMSWDTEEQNNASAGTDSGSEDTNQTREKALAAKKKKAGKRREARIPDPFQLQIPMPSPCKFFFRANVYRGTTIQELALQAAAHCRKYFPVENGCLAFHEEAHPSAERELFVGVEGSGAVGIGDGFTSNATAEETNLFNKRLSLVVRASVEGCSSAEMRE